MGRFYCVRMLTEFENRVMFVTSVRIGCPMVAVRSDGGHPPVNIFKLTNLIQCDSIFNEELKV